MSEQPLSAEAMQGRVWGCVFLGGFGMAWLLLGLAMRNALHALAVTVVLAIAAVLAALCVAVLRRAKSAPPSTMPAMEVARVERVFRAVNIIQWVAIVTAVEILNLLRHPEYISSAIGIIVGLHFLPLAEVFRQPLYRVTGPALVVWCLACMVLLPAGRVGGVTSLGVGLMLVGTALVSLRSALARPEAKAPFTV